MTLFALNYKCDKQQLFVLLKELCRDSAKMNFISSQYCRRVELAAQGERVKKKGSTHQTFRDFFQRCYGFALSLF